MFILLNSKNEIKLFSYQTNLVTPTQAECEKRACFHVENESENELHIFKLTKVSTVRKSKATIEKAIQ